MLVVVVVLLQNLIDTLHPGTVLCFQQTERAPPLQQRYYGDIRFSIKRAQEPS